MKEHDNSDLYMMLGFLVGSLVSRDVTREEILSKVDHGIGQAMTLKGKEHGIMQIVESLINLSESETIRKTDV